MSAQPQRARPAAPRGRFVDLARERVTLADGARTTVHTATYDVERVELRLALLGRPTALEAWCAKRGVSDAIVGGFFLRPAGVPLGEVRTGGIRRRSVPVAEPWHAVRACVHIEAGRVALARRDELAPEPAGDLLQAGPLLVRDGGRVVAEEADEEGFSAGAHQFDSDITRGRYPRAAIALTERHLVAIACDGRGRHDAGMTLVELAEALLRLGAVSAINLDGGGSTSLVSGGRLRNRPRSAVDELVPGGRPISTALEIRPRSG